MRKKKWVRPELTILSRRGHNQERVLTACKIGGFSRNPGPEGGGAACLMHTGTKCYVNSMVS